MKRLLAVLIVALAALPVAAEHFNPFNLEAIDRDRQAELFEPGARLAHLTPTVISMLTAEVRKLRKVAVAEDPPQSDFPAASVVPEDLIPPPGLSACVLGQGVCVTHIHEYLEMRRLAKLATAKDAEIERLAAALAKLNDSCVAKLKVVPVPPPAKKAIAVDPKTLNRS